MSLINELWESDEANALTNRAARRIEELEEALQVYAKQAERWNHYPDSWKLYSSSMYNDVTVGDYRKAKELLEKSGE